MQPITAGFTSRICSFMLPPALLPLLTATRLCSGNPSLVFWYGALFLFGVHKLLITLFGSFNYLFWWRQDMGTTEEIVKMCANPFFRGKKV